MCCAGDRGDGSKVVRICDDDLLDLEAPHIQASGAMITANGGAGGEGSDRNGCGVTGAAGTLTAGRANGGAGGAPTGSDGGDGGSALVPAGDSVTATADGGGGGGGESVGFIRVRSSDAASLMTSPSPS